MANEIITIENLKEFKVKMLSAIYPVGSVYISFSNFTSPASLFGGTWTQLKDRFLLAAGDTYSAGSTGGEVQHTLTGAEMPKHAHKVMYAGGTVQAQSKDGIVQANITPGWDRGIGWFDDKTGTIDVWADDTGGDKPHNNMPPFLAVYMWKRIA